MAALFEIAHAINHYGRERVPYDWEYQDSPLCCGLLSSADARETGEDWQARYVAARILRNSDRERAAIRAGTVAILFACYVYALARG